MGVREHLEGRNVTMKTFVSMLKDQSGASAAEYALILAIIGAGIAVAAYNLGTAISTAMSKSGSCINKQPSATAC
jgi:pilus assembly protein Flp/PilA